MIEVNNSAWNRQISRLAHDHTLDQRMYVPGKQLIGLESMTPEAACKALKQGIERIFVPNDQAVEIARSELGRAEAFAAREYPCPEEFLARVTEKPARAGANDSLAEDTYSYPRILSGLSGVGKSQLAAAMSRLFRPFETVDVSLDYEPFELEGYRVVNVGNSSTVPQVIRELTILRGSIEPGRVGPTLLHKLAKTHLYRRGVSMLALDEFQFMTQSQNATATVGKTMLTVSKLGVPWHAVMNYSLGWKLLGGFAQEMRNRMLTHVRVLLPDAPASRPWIRLMEEYRVVLYHLSDFDCRDKAVELWRLSAGLKYTLKELVVLAYEFARARGGKKLRWNDITSAYGSGEFSALRGDVEQLVANATGGAKLRRDLECPFQSEAVSLAQGEYREELRRARLAKVTVATVNASMTKRERAHLKVVTDAGSCSGSQSDSMKAKPRVRKKASTAEDLALALRNFRGACQKFCV